MGQDVFNVFLDLFGLDPVAAHHGAHDDPLARIAHKAFLMRQRRDRGLRDQAHLATELSRTCGLEDIADLWQFDRKKAHGIAAFWQTQHVVFEPVQIVDADNVQIKAFLDPYLHQARQFRQRMRGLAFTPQAVAEHARHVDTRAQLDPVQGLEDEIRRPGAEGGVHQIMFPAAGDHDDRRTFIGLHIADVVT